MKAGIVALAIAGALAPGVAIAQAKVCVAPGTIAPPRPELPNASEPRRVLPIGGYTLALTWAPQFCRNAGFSPSARFQCGSGNRFGFTLHGLWPDGVGKDWPQYCEATPILPPAMIRSEMCRTPSAQLIQHEWAKHGTCTGMSALQYFETSSQLYGSLRYPDMDALSRKPLTVGDFAAAFAAANPGMPASAVRVTAKSGWLDELWLCLDKYAGSYVRCRPNTGGLPANARLKIWRGGR